jgi:putative membrane protein
MRDNIPEESPMTPIARRSFIAALSAASVGGAVTAARAVDALPDARFVGFAQAVNDFGVASGNLALARSGNENVRAFATRSIAEHTEMASELAKSRQEAGVAYAPDGRMGPNVQNLLARLGQLQGPAFDAEFARAQLMVQTEAADQTGAYSQSGKSGPLRRYAQRSFPKSQMFLEYAKRLAGAR